MPDLRQLMISAENPNLLAGFYRAVFERFKLFKWFHVFKS